ncbi:phosphotransferase [Demequina sp. NBRC 110052]|uniref:phosphotransferase n=1 Tax=Demequina sp. NBRC 110052 TaxID=1570341 RepID=UPI0009FCD823|nr:phosphotransferase [Demequina sp. NBRC 110052]
MSARGSGPSPARTSLGDEFIRALLTERAPEYAHLPFGRRYGDMEEHESVRLGDEFIVEFPREPRIPSWDPAAMQHLAEASRDWDFKVRVPERICEPALGYRYRFEIARWFDSSTAIRSPLATEAARDLGRALAQIHAAPTPGAPIHDATGAPLPWRSAMTFERLERARGLRSPEGREVDDPAVRDAWESAVAAGTPLARTWITGSMDPRLVMASHGRFAGLVYWREYSVGDPVNDLGVATLLFGPRGTDLLLEGYGKDSEDLRLQMRAVGIKRSLLYIQSSNPAISRLGWTRLGDLGALTEGQPDAVAT